MHTDAAQAVGKVPVDVAALGVDLLSVAGHKLYAPKGIGALYVRNGIDIAPQIRGAAHERGLRAGTENVLLATGLGAACKLAGAEVAAEQECLAGLRDRLFGLFNEGFTGVVEHGDPANRLPNTLSVAFPGVDASQLLFDLGNEVAASAGAACHSEGVSVSHVLEAMGVDEAAARSTVRFSVGRFTTEEEIDQAAEIILARANS